MAIKSRRVEVGDAVLWNGELYRVDWIESDDQVILLNTREEVSVDPFLVTPVGKDTLSGLGAQSLFKRVKSSVGRKTDTISTAGLITDEVKRLKSVEDAPKPIPFPFNKRKKEW